MIPINKPVWCLCVSQDRDALIFRLRRITFGKWIEGDGGHVKLTGFEHLLTLILWKCADRHSVQTTAEIRRGGQRSEDHVILDIESGDQYDWQQQDQTRTARNRK